MTPSRRERDNQKHASDSVATSAAVEAANKAKENSQKTISRVFLVLRIALFVAACVFAVLGVKGFIDASNTQTVSRIATVEAIRGEPVRHALVLISYDDSDAKVSSERSGVAGILNGSGVSADIVYLDARSTTGNSESEKRLSESITEKALAAGGYDVIVSAGNEALAYVLKNQVLFGGVPAAYFGVNDMQLVKAARDTGIATGFYEAGAAQLSLETAADLLPNAKTAVILTDGSAESIGLEQQLDQAQGIAKGVERDVWDVSEMTRDKLAEKLGDLDSSSFVLLLAANHDADGGVYTPTQTAYFLFKNAKVPVFSAIGGVGEGICGASFIDLDAESSETARLAIELLNGAKPSEKPYSTVEPACTVFDAEKLNAFGINPDDTPTNATIINESAFSWRVLRPLIQPALFILVAIVCITAFGIIGFRRSMRSNRAIIESRNDLQYRLYHDLLTDLPNRHALEQLAATEDESGKMKAIVQIDIDDFTDINDSYGHAFGNEIIQIIGKRLRSVRSSMLARSGGDEFTLTFDRTLSPESHELGQINRIFNDPVIVGDSKLDISASLGVANREEGMTGEDMIIYADLATHNAKETNAHQPVFYSHDMRESMERKLEITETLKKQIADESINVLWQPQVNTADLTVYGYEALCRLEGNVYYPGDFIPVAEMSGLVVPIGRIVTKKVVEQMGKWLKQGREVGIASINYSAAQLRDKDYCNFLADLLATNKVPASLIKIEITESMILDNEEDASQLFTRLRSMGVTLALDDFGTGYSSLHRMSTRPVDVVKLDKSLVDTYMVPGKEGFIDDITRLIHGIDKEIVVEGVETLEQFEMCQKFGCDVIQGYFFSRPIPAAEAIAFDPKEILPDFVPEKDGASGANGKARNADWSKYDRDSHGRWTKKSKK